MSTSGSDPSTTRPPSEGGWFRFGAELPDPGVASQPSVVPQPAAPLDPAEARPTWSEASWNPIPTFQPTTHPSAPPYPILDVAPANTPPPVPAVGVGASWHTTPGRTTPHRTTPRRRRLPDYPVEYPQLLRGPTRAWWRPLLALAVFVAVFAVLSVLPFLVVMAYGQLTGVDDVDLWMDEQLAEVMAPGGYLFLNLGLIVLIPAAMLSIWAVHRIRPRFLSSVAGGLRWHWLLRCVLVLVPLWGVYLAISTITDPPQSPRSDQWVAFLVIGLLLTPWQAAAEEYAFRGWLTQNLGAYFARPLLAFGVPTVVATAVFAAAHGSPDPWILADLAVFALAASIMTWRTGGLEAAIAMHAVNNVGIGILMNTIGGFEESFVGTETTGTPMSFAVSLLVHGIALVLVLWQARRSGVQRWFRPPPTPHQPLPAAAVSASA